MSKRELNLSDKELLPTTKEDRILKSPPRIPNREVQNISSLKTIQTIELDSVKVEEKQKVFL